ncbi:hypothetical protein HK405_016019 [Cladochytrium tenue]|nr:hypothetical protein HK405_016019 [Cladochytrium tenue]
MPRPTAAAAAARRAALSVPVAKPAAATATTPRGPVWDDAAAAGSRARGGGGGGVRVAVRVRPGARSTRVVAITSECVEMALAAPPRDGLANAELVAALAKILRCPRTSVAVESGGRSRIKTVAIEAGAVDAAQALHRLRAELSDGEEDDHGEGDDNTDDDDE